MADSNANSNRTIIRTRHFIDNQGTLYDISIFGVKFINATPKLRKFLYNKDNERGNFDIYCM